MTAGDLSVMAQELSGPKFLMGLSLACKICRQYTSVCLSSTNTVHAVDVCILLSEWAVCEGVCTVFMSTDGGHCEPDPKPTEMGLQLTLVVFEIKPCLNIFTELE